MLTKQIVTAHDSSRIAKALSKTLTTSTVTLMMCLLFILLILTATADRGRYSEDQMTGRKTKIDHVNIRNTKPQKDNCVKKPCILFELWQRV